MIGVLQKNNVIYQFKSLLGDCLFENNTIYVSSTLTTLSQRFTMHIGDTSSKAQHWKRLSCPLKKPIHVQQQNYEKFLPKTQQY